MYVISTSRPSTAVLGAAVGFFCGGGASNVVLNRGSLLSVYAVRADSSGIDHLHDFHLNATVKYVRSIPIMDSAAERHRSRHLLFLCTIKQELLLVALERASDTDPGSPVLRMTTLFHSEPTDCLYQYDPNEVDLCCCTTFTTDADHTSLSLQSPFVAFAMARGELFLLDVFAALARDAVKRKRSSHLTRLFSADLIAEIVRRAKAPIFTHSYMDSTEYDVKDITFGDHTAESCGSLQVHVLRSTAAMADKKCNTTASFPLYILYADPYGKVHVSEYHVQPWPVREVDGDSETGAGGVTPLPPHRPRHTSVPFQGAPQIRRCGNLQPNVDPTATKIVMSRHGLFVVGNHLVTLIQQVRLRKCVFSREIPLRQSTLEVSCAGTSQDATELVVGFSDGVFARVSVLAGLSNSEDPDLEFRFLPRPVPTIPTEVVALHHNLCLLCSRFDSTFTVRLDDLSCEQVLHNCGPALDMITHQTGPRCSVVACTGISRSGGVSVLRSAVMMLEEAVIDLQCPPQRVLCAHGLLCISASGSNRFFQVSRESLTVDEVSPTALPDVVTCHPLIAMGTDVADHTVVLVSARGVVWLRLEGGPSYRRISQLLRQADESDLLFAGVRHGWAVVCDGRAVVAYCGQDVHYELPTLADVDVSALALLDTICVAIGYWDGSVALYALSSTHAELVKSITLHSVPRSIACVDVILKPPWGNRTSPQLLFIGTLDGTLVETTEQLLRSGEVRRSISVAPHPVELQELGGAHAGLVCLGDVPLVVFCDGSGGLQLTGLHLMGVTSAAIVDAERQCYAFYSKQDRHLHIGCLEALEKSSQTFLPLGDTITQLQQTPAWGGYAVSLRKVEGDEILFLPSTAVQSPWVGDPASWRSGAISLLENERCVFLEMICLGSANEEEDPDEGGELDELLVNASSATVKNNMQQVLLVGSSFVFPDEQRARSGRITWCTLQETEQRRQLRLLSSKDIGGALQCCAVVPRYKGRIALGVNGCVYLYKWNPEDQTFVAEERCRLGLTVTKLIPLYKTKATASVLVALDVRYSAFFVEVDTLQGSLKVLCRDSQLRGVMDGYINSDAECLHLFDDNRNFIALRMVPLPVEAQHDGVDGAVANVSSVQYRFEVRAQCHLGDLVVCVRPGSFAATSLMEGVCTTHPPQPRLLLPGISGSQIVFATAHGGFGVVTPLSTATYFFLRAMEVALERTTQPVAGLGHHTFKEVLHTGQERGVSYSASKSGSLLSRERGDRYEAFNVVDGDLVERFVLLSSHEKRHVCSVATEVFLCAFSSCLDDAESFVPPPAKQEQCPVQRSNLPTSVRTQHSPETVAKACSFLQEQGLPLLPFSPAALEQQVTNLQRVH